jgi:hypothetical protein
VDSLWRYKNQKEEYASTPEDSAALKEIAPSELVSSKRLDIMPRYLLCKDFLNGIENKAHLSLYSRMILCIVNGRVGASYFGEHQKENMDAFITQFKDLTASIHTNGFDRAHYVPMGDDGNPMNGMHRISAALATEKDIWVKYYNGMNHSGEARDMDWFARNGFGAHDRLRILRAFADLYPNCGIALLYGVCKDQWAYIQAQIEKKMTSVGFVDLDFTHNFIAYENLLRDIYQDPKRLKFEINHKIDLLKLGPLCVRVVLVSDENDKGLDLYETLRRLKLDIRKSMFFETDEAPIVMHATDSRFEFEYLKKVILSVNNLRCLEWRITNNYGNAFVDRIERFKMLLLENGLNIEDVVVVGSSGLEIFGLRKANDLDFAIRERYGGRGEALADNDGIDLKNQEQAYPDDVIVTDDNFHYMFCGVKFLNLDLLKLQKQRRRTGSDSDDVKRMEIFEDFVTNYDDKAALRAQIERVYHQREL